MVTLECKVYQLLFQLHQQRAAKAIGCQNYLLR